jgi:SAM-dependent methyltransferase
MKHIGAPLAGFSTIPAIESMQIAMDPNYGGRPTRKFPIRYLRYWFMRQALDDLSRRLNRPLRVLEVGIGLGKMLAFMGGAQIAPGRHALPDTIASWDALSAEADPRTLHRYSYSSFQQADIEEPYELAPASYDAVIVLHVLEHLWRPEEAMRRLLPSLRVGGLLIGGSPTMPGAFARLHERWLHRKFADKLDDVLAHRHLSVMSPGRIRRFAKAEGLGLDLLSGAFLMRASRSPLEDRSWWLRANLAWGALFPALGGEVYFALRMTHEASLRRCSSPPVAADWSLEPAVDPIALPPRRPTADVPETVGVRARELDVCD